MDSIRQFETGRLERIVVGRPDIVAILCGHAHTAATTTFAGRPLLAGPGVVSTSLLDWEPGGFVDPDLPPAVAFHLLDAAGRLTTHYRTIPV